MKKVFIVLSLTLSILAACLPCAFAEEGAATDVYSTNLIHSLNLLWQGMLAIFVVMTIIFVAVAVLHKVTNKKNNQQ